MDKFMTNKTMYYPDRICSIINKGICGPVQAEITLTTACDYKCPWCVFDYMKSKPVTSIDYNKLVNFLEDFRYLGGKSVVYAGSGEPTLHKDFINILNTTKKLGIPFGVTTNGSIMSDEMIETLTETASWVRVSLGSIYTEEFIEAHGAKAFHLDNVKNNLVKLVQSKQKYKRNVEIGVQSLITSNDEMTYLDIVHFCDMIDVDYVMLRPFYPNPNNPVSINQKFELPRDVLNEIVTVVGQAKTNHTKVFARMETLDLMYKKSYNLCRFLPFVFALESDGRVFNCFPNRKDESEFCVGNINENSLLEIWGGEKHKKFLNEIMPGIDKSECQPYCRHHAGNEYMESLFSPPEGVEFI